MRFEIRIQTESFLRRILLKINLSEIILPFQRSRFDLDYPVQNRLVIRDQSNHEVANDMCVRHVPKSLQHFNQIFIAYFVYQISIDQSMTEVQAFQIFLIIAN